MSQEASGGQQPTPSQPRAESSTDNNCLSTSSVVDAEFNDELRINVACAIYAGQWRIVIAVLHEVLRQHGSALTEARKQQHYAVNNGAYSRRCLRAHVAVRVL